MENNSALLNLEADIGNTFETVQELINNFFAILPKLAIALILFIIIWLMGRLVSYFIRHSFKGQRRNLGKALGRLTMVGFLFGGLILAVAIVAPSVGAAELFQLLGIGSIAIGFAFRDILQNFLAGLLILLRQPFNEGDTVIYQNTEGVVESIETRATYLRKYDGNRVIIPNGEVFKNEITVITADPDTRSEYDFGISYNSDINKAIKTIVTTLESFDKILKEPAPDVGVIDLAGSSVNIRARWWTNAADRYDVRVTVLQAVKEALDDANIEIPYPQHVVHIPDMEKITQVEYQNKEDQTHE